MKIGSYEVKPLNAVQRRISLLLWGKAGSGKTTLASTMPGKKLWINFDPDGVNSLGARDDILLLDLAKQSSAVVTAFKDEDPMLLSRFITENAIESVVVDSITSFAELAVSHSYQGGKAPGATFENPGMAGYGQRNRFALALVRHVLRVTDHLNRHVAFIAHEDVPLKDKDGNVLGSSLLLGGSLQEEIPLKMSEVWHLRDVTPRKMITVRSVPLYKPMKTRMFSSDSVEFEWKYKPETRVGMRIEDWYNAWQQNNFDKIGAPK